jgi:hypothetical protein
VGRKHSFAGLAASRFFRKHHDQEGEKQNEVYRCRDWNKAHGEVRDAAQNSEMELSGFAIGEIHDS